MMRYHGESLITIDVDYGGIGLMDSSDTYDHKFSDAVERGEFICDCEEKHKCSCGGC